MRRTFLLHTVGAVLALAMLAGVASAAQISQISWDVTGGSFDGPNLSGPITGGSIVLTRHSPISTPLEYRFMSTYQGLQVELSLTGPAGTFAILMPPGFAELFRLTAHYILMSLHEGRGVRAVSGSAVITFDFAYFFLRYNNRPVPIGPSGFGAISNGASGVGHGFQIGNEVRTEVPEAGTGPMIALGLLGLGWVARPRGAIARMLRHRRG